MGEGKFYRPGTRKGGKIWNFLGLGALLLLMVSVFFVGGLAVRNPGLIPALLSGKLQLWPKPAPTPQKIVLDPNQPESYLGLLNGIAVNVADIHKLSVWSDRDPNGPVCYRN